MRREYIVDLKGDEKQLLAAVARANGEIKKLNDNKVSIKLDFEKASLNDLENAMSSIANADTSLNVQLEYDMNTHYLELLRQKAQETVDLGDLVKKGDTDEVKDNITAISNLITDEVDNINKQLEDGVNPKELLGRAQALKNFVTAITGDEDYEAITNIETGIQGIIRTLQNGKIPDGLINTLQQFHEMAKTVGADDIADQIESITQSVASGKSAKELVSQFKDLKKTASDFKEMLPPTGLDIGLLPPEQQAQIEDALKKYESLIDSVRAFKKLSTGSFTGFDSRIESMDRLMSNLQSKMGVLEKLGARAEETPIAGIGESLRSFERLIELSGTLANMEVPTIGEDVKIDARIAGIRKLADEYDRTGEEIKHLQEVIDSGAGTDKTQDELWLLQKYQLELAKAAQKSYENVAKADIAELRESGIDDREILSPDIIADDIEGNLRDVVSNIQRTIGHALDLTRLGEGDGFGDVLKRVFMGLKPENMKDILGTEFADTMKRIRGEVETEATSLEEQAERLQRVQQLMNTIDNINVGKGAQGEKNANAIQQKMKQVSDTYDKIKSEIKSLEESGDDSPEIKERIGLLQSLATAYQEVFKNSVPARARKNEELTRQWFEEKGLGKPEDWAVFSDTDISDAAKNFYADLKREMVAGQASLEAQDFKLEFKPEVNTSALEELRGILMGLFQDENMVEQIMKKTQAAMNGQTEATKEKTSTTEKLKDAVEEEAKSEEKKAEAQKEADAAVNKADAADSKSTASTDAQTESLNKLKAAAEEAAEAKAKVAESEEKLSTSTEESTSKINAEADAISEEDLALKKRYNELIDRQKLALDIDESMEYMDVGESPANKRGNNKVRIMTELSSQFDAVMAQIKELESVEDRTLEMDAQIARLYAKAVKLSDVFNEGIPASVDNEWKARHEWAEQKLGGIDAYGWGIIDNDDIWYDFNRAKRRITNGFDDIFEEESILEHFGLDDNITKDVLLEADNMYAHIDDLIEKVKERRAQLKAEQDALAAESKQETQPGAATENLPKEESAVEETTSAYEELGQAKRESMSVGTDGESPTAELEKEAEKAREAAEAHKQLADAKKESESASASGQESVEPEKLMTIAEIRAAFKEKIKRERSKELDDWADETQAELDLVNELWERGRYDNWRIDSQAHVPTDYMKKLARSADANGIEGVSYSDALGLNSLTVSKDGLKRFAQYMLDAERQLEYFTLPPMSDEEYLASVENLHNSLKEQYNEIIDLEKQATELSDYKKARNQFSKESILSELGLDDDIAKDVMASMDPTARIEEIIDSVEKKRKELQKATSSLEDISPSEEGGADIEGQVESFQKLESAAEETVEAVEKVRAANEGLASSANTTAPAVQNEADSIGEIPASSDKAAASKEELREANEKLNTSAEETAVGIDKEATSMDGIPTSTNISDDSATLAERTSTALETEATALERIAAAGTWAAEGKQAVMTANQGLSESALNSIDALEREATAIETIAKNGREAADITEDFAKAQQAEAKATQAQNYKPVYTEQDIKDALLRNQQAFQAYEARGAATDDADRYKRIQYALNNPTMTMAAMDSLGKMINEGNIAIDNAIAQRTDLQTRLQKLNADMAELETKGIAEQAPNLYSKIQSKMTNAQAEGTDAAIKAAERSMRQTQTDFDKVLDASFEKTQSRFNELMGNADFEKFNKGRADALKMMFDEIGGADDVENIKMFNEQLRIAGQEQQQMAENFAKYGQLVSEGMKLRERMSGADADVLDSSFMDRMNKFEDMLSNPDFDTKSFGKYITDLSSVFDGLKLDTDNMLGSYKADFVEIQSMIQALGKGERQYLKDFFTATPVNSQVDSMKEYVASIKEAREAVEQLGKTWGGDSAFAKMGKGMLEGFERTLTDDIGKRLVKEAQANLDLIARQTDKRQNQGSGFTEEYSNSLSKVKTEMEEIIGYFKSFNPGDAFDATKLDGFINKLKSGKDTLKEINDQQNLLATQNQLTKLLGKVNQDIAKGAQYGELGAKYQGLKDDIEAAITSLKDADNIGDALSKIDFNNFATLREQLHATGVEIGAFNGTFMSKFSEAITNQSAQFLATYFSFQDMVRYGKQIVSSVTATDSALIELRKVSDISNDRLQQSFKTSADTAQDLGSTITDVIDATSTWARAGYSIKEAEDLARVSTLFATVGDNMTQESATSTLISTMKGFGMEADSALQIVDKFNSVANSQPIDTSQLSDALQKSASAFNSANTDLSKSIALVTASFSVLQDSSTVGTLWNTTAARIRGGVRPSAGKLAVRQNCLAA